MNRAGKEEMVVALPVSSLAAAAAGCPVMFSSSLPPVLELP